MENKPGTDSKIKSILLDVIYGAVIAYGFTFFDKASDFTDYFRFFFAYTVFIVDFIYVHQKYWDANYKNIFFVLDIGIIFSISRLLFLSTASTPDYYLWLSILFGCYVAWDVSAKFCKLSFENDWRYSIGGDLFACIAFLAFWKPPSIITILSDSLFLTIGTLIVYFIARLTWSKKAPILKVKTK